jgi:thiol-disulfide isomerase/thioredoxin
MAQAADPPRARRAPALAIEGFDGRALDWSAFGGKVVLLDFWASWCGPCKRSMPHLQALHEKYGKRGLVVLGVSIDPPHAEKSARALVAGEQYGYRFAFDSQKTPTWKRYDVSIIPSAFLVDGQGNIIAQWTGLPASFSEMDQKIEALLATQP